MRVLKGTSFDVWKDEVGVCGSSLLDRTRGKTSPVESRVRHCRDPGRTSESPTPDLGRVWYLESLR